MGLPSKRRGGYLKLLLRQPKLLREMRPELLGSGATPIAWLIMGGFQWGVPQNNFIEMVKNPIKMDDLVYFMENTNLKWMMSGGTPISGNP